MTVRTSVDRTIQRQKTLSIHINIH